MLVEMTVNYTFNENCYVLTNFGDSNNPLFSSKEEVENFKVRIDKHLSPLCEIMGFSFHNDQYSILIGVKSREVFVDFYRRKHKSEGIPVTQIPDSTYILSQEMANLQAGYAKWFNFRHKRFGSLFGRRYTKILIEDEEELQTWKDRINGKTRLWTFEELWSWVKNFIKERKKFDRISESSAELYGGVVKGVKFSSFIMVSEFLLRGHYKSRPRPPHLSP